MKGETDISKDREPKGLSKVSSAMKQAKMEQEPSKRNSYSGTHASVSAPRQTGSQEQLTQAVPHRRSLVEHSSGRELQNFRHKRMLLMDAHL